MAFDFKRFFSFRRTPIVEPESARRGFTYVSGVQVNEQVAMKVAAYYRGVIYLATQVAKLPWEVKNKDYEVQEDDISYLLNLQPNPEMDAMTFRILKILSTINTGNFIAEIERNVIGQPIALWPIATSRVDLKRDIRGNLVYRVSGGSTSGEDVYLYPRDVYHLKNFNTKDGLWGIPTLVSAAKSLGISTGADSMASNLFANSGIPSGVLKHKGTLSDEAYKRLKDSWRTDNGGENSGGVALLEEGTEFEALNMDPNTLQMLDSRKFGVLEIARFLGVPPTKLFDMSAATYSNAEQANLEVATDTLDAWARKCEMEADIKLLNKGYGGKFTEMDVYAITRADMKTRADYFSKLMQNGAITPNQIRAREGQSPYDGGDRYWIAVNNMSPVDRVDEVVDSQIKKNEPVTPTKDVTPEEKALTQAAIDLLNR